MQPLVWSHGGRGAGKEKWAAPAVGHKGLECPEGWGKAEFA